MHKQQVVTIGGWSALENLFSETFLQNRKKYIQEESSYDPYKSTLKWKNLLSEQLWETYEVFKMPTPHSDSAVYEEWKIMFEKMFPYFSGEILLLWHSLWATFIAKYLNENPLSIWIKKILLVAPAFQDSEEEVLGSFNFDTQLSVLKKYSETIHLYYSTDDMIVSPRDAEQFISVLWDISVRKFTDRGHFFSGEFPEIVTDITCLTE